MRPGPSRPQRLESGRETLPDVDFSEANARGRRYPFARAGEADYD